MVHVCLYVPNLIGYARIVLLFVCYAVARAPASASPRAPRRPAPPPAPRFRPPHPARRLRDWKLAASCYMLSFAGDLFDGWAARKFDQTSQFGYVLDMVTDRCATTGLISILCGLYPKWIPSLLFCQMLDLGSHWYHMYSTSTERGHHKSKEALAERNVVLRMYYGSYPLFAYLCVGAEFFWIALYVLHYAPDFGVGPLRLAFVCRYGFAPAMALKSVVNLAQFGSAAENLALRDMEKQGKKRN
jgi:CDP-diacylglycerol--inositol 3-phosphatidyltransferase